MKNHLLVGMWIGFFCFTGPNGFADPAQSEKAISRGLAKPLAGILNPDGTLRLDRSIQGSFDPSGFRMVSGPGQPPRFVPAASPEPMAGASAAPSAGPAGYWDDRFFTVGVGNTSSGADEVYSLAVDNGSLFIGGDFSIVGNAAANNVAKWDGTSWNSLGSGTDGTVLVLAVVGTDLYAGGVFLKAGGIPASYLAKWDGTSWSARRLRDQRFRLGVEGFRIRPLCRRRLYDRGRRVRQPDRQVERDDLVRFGFGNGKARFRQVRSSDTDLYPESPSSTSSIWPWVAAFNRPGWP